MKFLPGIYTVCVGRMIFWAMVVILFVATIVKILNETFNRHIGLYGWINFASFFFGKRIIVPKLRQCKGKVLSCTGERTRARVGLETSAGPRHARRTREQKAPR